MPEKLPPDTNGDVPFETVIKALADDVEVLTTSEAHPTDGRIIEDPADGTIYIGDGSSWTAVANNTGVSNLGALSTEEGAIGEMWPRGGGTGVVAPSYSQAFSSIQSALDAGYRFIWLAEDVTENGIEITEPVVIRGVGGGQSGLPTIHDPQDGKPVINVPTDDYAKFVHLQDFRISGGIDSGPAIDAGAADSPDTSDSASWRIQNIESRAGAWMLGGSYRTTIINCNVENLSDTTYTRLGKSGLSPSIYHDGTTFAMYGGTYASNYGEDNAVISSGSFSITGGITFSNKAAQDSGNNNHAALTLTNALNGFVGGCTTEVGDPGMRLGNKESGLYGLLNTVITTVSGSIQTEQNSEGVVLFPSGSVDIQKGAPNSNESNPSAKILAFAGNSSVTVSGNRLWEVSVLEWGDDGNFRIGHGGGDTYTAFGVDVVSSEPSFAAVGTEVIADGTNWDPDSDGNAEKVILTNSGWMEIQDLGTAL